MLVVLFEIFPKMHVIIKSIIIDIMFRDYVDEVDEVDVVLNVCS